ncbi:MAG: hypothetical protein G01um101425_112 [Candidatus Peregrinibacteria bacterium Gr01-1014_25]|nr:MAG: hypothetical protein G01um101425_112 [Candidatus Peregrinibacteria bacterium Gr01-1014_25]
MYNDRMPPDTPTFENPDKPPKAPIAPVNPDRPKPAVPPAPENPDNPKGPKAAMRKEAEKTDRHRDARLADRLMRSPDLDEALKQLKPQIDNVRKFIDGSYHEQRGMNLIKISEFQKEIDVLNGQIKQLRDQGKSFAATDVWGTALGMDIVPDDIGLKLPMIRNPKMNDAYFARQNRKDTLHSQQPLLLRVRKEGLALVGNENRDDAVDGIDTNFMTLKSTGTLTKDAQRHFIIALGPVGARQSDLLTRRAEAYGIPVTVQKSGNTQTVWLDLHGAEWKSTQKRFLQLDIPSNDVSGRLQLTDKPPSAK